MVRSRHLDLRELLAGGAILIHVALRRHGVQVHRNGAERIFKRLLGYALATVAYCRAATAEISQRNKGDAAFACRDGLGSVCYEVKVRRTAGVSLIEMPYSQV